MLIHRKFFFPKGCNVAAVIMRETDGHDEKDAAKLADIRDSSITGELVRASIVQVKRTADSEFAGADQPFVELDGWNSKTRDLALEAFRLLNDVSKEEKAVFLATSEDVAPLVVRAEPRPGGMPATEQ